MKKNNSGFIWGTATSSYQIEGAWNADGKGKNIWDTFSQVPGNIRNNDNGNNACDHYNRYAEDVGLLSQLGVDAYRLSLSWARLIPDGTGQVNQKGIDFYNRLFDELLAKNITPFVTLYHWDLPQALQDRGGWVNRDIVGWFENYAQVVARQYGDRIKDFCVINEPSVSAYLGHFQGVHAPGIKNLSSMYAATHHQNIVSGHMAKLIHNEVKDSNVGSAYTYFPTYPNDPSKEEDVVAASVIDAVWTRNFLDPVCLGKYPEASLPALDSYIKSDDLKIISYKTNYVGINHYSPNYIRHDKDDGLKAVMCAGPDGARNDLGWLVDAAEFEKIFVEIKQRYNNPKIYVLENGMCDNLTPDEHGKVHDERRVSYLNSYINAMLNAKTKHGCNIDGYFVWSAFDNFEWAEGYFARFGIVYVDYENGCKRIPKDSYYWYKDMIKTMKDNQSGKVAAAK